LKERALSIALLTRGRQLDDEVLEEMLEHQGVPLEVVPLESASARAHHFPIAVMSHRSAKERHGLSVMSTVSEAGDAEGVIFADEVVDLQKVGRLLRGERDDRKDNFDLEVNVEEEKLAKLLARRMGDLGLPLVLKSRWPGGARACCVLTHDVDWLSFSPFHKVVLKGLKTKPSRIPGLVYGGAVRGRNFGWNIPETIELERKYGYRSTFLLMTRYAEPKSLLAKTIEAMRSARCEIALHGSESSHLSVGALKAELELFRAMVGSYPTGVRNHILKFKAPYTWAYQGELGLQYDATFGYNRYFGFRGGVCLPYHPFNEDGRLPIIELPTGFMDWTALHRRRDASAFGQYLETVRRRVEEFNGLLVVNFHNTYLNAKTFPSILSEYEALLQKIKGEKYWVATAAECAAWWRKRASAKINPRLTEGGEILVDASSGVSVHTFDSGDMSRLRLGGADGELIKSEAE